MSEYTPTTEEVRETYFITGYKTTPEQFDRWLRQVKAEAWDEGHKHSWRREPDKCQCSAWSWSECGCGKYGSGELLSLNENPYRKETE